MAAALLILAAGLGTRFKGGKKQLASVGTSGEMLMEYSVYDAVKAGFDKAVIVTRRDIEGQLREKLGDRLNKHIAVEYCFQDTALPDDTGLSGFSRTKPWGTVHAVLAAKENIGGEPFLIVNSDDYYGKKIYKKIYDFLTSPERSPKEQCMGGFILKNTLSDSGTVNRGVCGVNDLGCLSSVTETYRISGTDRGIVGERSGEPVSLSGDSLVSMNMWGFDSSVIGKLELYFRDFLKNAQAEGTLETAECILPKAADKLIRAGDISVKVLPTDDKWLGMTYAEDFPEVCSEISRMTAAGEYPSPLF
ncbi:MAG: NTP transferase domain-containing protein [Ruminococcus sp.]|nr:NTP transferase domain-containing protein [Ruminococcus sp.]